MNTLLLEPNDVLFFKDGRPMSSGLAGHGAAWPLPTVTSAALHAALWRAGLEAEGRAHRPRYRSRPSRPEGTRRFGSLVTAGPFAVNRQTGRTDTWYFPRPADAEESGSIEVTLQPVPIQRSHGDWSSSLPGFLTHGVACVRKHEDSEPKPWWSEQAWQCYLDGRRNAVCGPDEFLPDRRIFGSESTVGIGIDPATACQDGERIYSAHYLRLQAGWHLGLIADCLEETDDSSSAPDRDLLHHLFLHEERILVGGQQRACTVELLRREPLRLPRGRSAFATDRDGKCRVKWILLSPAVWPAIRDTDEQGNRIVDRRGREIQPHCGGWAPNWVADRDWPGKLDGRPVAAGDVLLQSDVQRTKRKRQKRDGTPIRARLVAAVVPKPIPVTGYALPHAEANRASGGPKPTHLAVPAGAVYYFETEDANGLSAAQHAANLADVLNWHGVAVPAGQPAPTRIRNRRSTLFGEKGFGLGVCGVWNPIDSPSH